jgi:hypothetical protein
VDENLEDQIEEPTESTNEATKSNDVAVKKMKYVSAMQYYAYILCDRSGNYLHYFGRLFHQFIVDQFAKIELGRLNFFRHNQDKLRADNYQNIIKTDSNNLGKTTGQRIILPSTYKGLL